MVEVAQVLNKVQTCLIFKCTDFYSHKLVHCKQAMYEETIQRISLGL